jgi:selenocysteine lyase/cysteine desulfurase
MRTVQWDNKKAMAAKLAELAGCSKEEMIITRNTTESLDLVISGIHWEKGDEAVMAEQDYGAMLNQFKLMEKRYGIVNKVVSVPNHPKSDQEIVDVYANAITDKTKLLMVCHMINITGHILPIRKICDMAHSKGVQVMVDGAHAFAHINYSIADLDCDYYGTSLHKWLSVPLGSGFLYVKKGNVDKLWPLLAEGEREPGDISILNHIGTHPVHTDLAISNAIDFLQKLGRDKKEERLRYLQHYWSDQVRGKGNIIINTPIDLKKSCGIANVGIKGMEPKALADTLIEKYKIYTVPINGANVFGCRITPNVYTTTQELDVFVKALKEMGNA